MKKNFKRTISTLMMAAFIVGMFGGATLERNTEMTANAETVDERAYQSIVNKWGDTVYRGEYGMEDPEYDDTWKEDLWDASAHYTKTSNKYGFYSPYDRSHPNGKHWKNGDSHPGGL